MSGRHTDQQADAQFPAGERWDPDPAKHINFLLAEVNKLEKQKDEAVENAKHWHGFSQNANEQHSALERDKAALEQRINSLERQLNEEQASKLALKRRVSILFVCIPDCQSLTSTANRRAEAV